MGNFPFISYSFQFFHCWKAQNMLQNIKTKKTSRLYSACFGVIMQ